MKNVWILFAFISLLILPHALYPKTERFRLLDTGNGLFNNQVRFITQMKDGKMLVYTEGMFNVYNGNRFEPLSCDLTYTLPLGMHNICTTYDGGNGLLWAKDFYRLYLIDTRTQRFCYDIQTRFKASDIREPLNDFILDRDRNAWLITESGKLYRYDWKQTAQLVYRPQPQEVQKGIRVKDVMQAGPFHFIFLNTGKLLCWEGKSRRIVWEDTTVAEKQPSEYFRTAWLQADEQHLLISISHKEGFEYTYNIYTREWKEILKGTSINDIQKDQNGDFWLGGSYALIRLSPDFKIMEECHNFKLTDGREINDDIMSVCIERHHGLWLGMGSTGVLRAIPANRYAESYANTAATSEKGHLIRALEPYDAQQLGVGTLDGLFLFHTNTQTYEKFNTEFSHVFCTDIKKDNQGHFWLSTRQGLYLLKDRSAARYDTRLIPSPSSAVIRLSLPLSDGRILVCLDLKEVYLCNFKNQAPIHLNKKYPILNRIRAMSFAVEIKPGQLLIGGQNGLFGYEVAKNKLEPIAWIAPWEKYSTKYNCIYAEKDFVWIGTQNGLIRHDFRRKQTIRFSTADGLPNNCIQGLAADLHGNLWISTSNGIGKIHRNRQGEYSFASLDETDGVQYGEMMEQSIAFMPNGHLYIGGINGITDIIPQMTEYKGTHLIPTLVGLNVMGHPIDNEGMFHGRQLLPEGLSYTHTLQLKYNENFLEMRFSALDYDTPQHTHYRYRLQGLE
ncbi:MAG: hypothetical protein LUC45_02730 [Paraprevotella sp.]|nr:hypothetical protein [Paraprevotella sp.]